MLHTGHTYILVTVGYLWCSINCIFPCPLVHYFLILFQLFALLFNVIEEYKIRGHPKVYRSWWLWIFRNIQRICLSWISVDGERKYISTFHLNENASFQLQKYRVSGSRYQQVLRSYILVSRSYTRLTASSMHTSTNFIVSNIKTEHL